MKIYLKSIRCYKDTSEFDSDEPYVLVFTARMGLRPEARTVLYGPWGDIDSGDPGRTGSLFYGPGGVPLMPPKNIWGISGEAETPPDPDKVIIIAALMENDNGRPQGVRAALHAQLVADLASAPTNLTRDQLAQRLLQTMRDALRGPITIGVLNNDDLIDVGEISIHNALRARLPTIVSQHMNGDGGRYEMFFEIAP
jgi:hypothetical protein